MVVGVDYVASELNLGFILPLVRHSKALLLGSHLSVVLANNLSFCVPYHLILIVASIWRLLFFRLATAVLPQTFQTSIACNLRKIATAQPTPEDLASMALPPSAFLCFWYSWLAVAVGRPPCPRALSKALWPWIVHILARVHGSRWVLLRISAIGFEQWIRICPTVTRCYLSILFVETLSSLVTILLSLVLLQRRAVWDIEFGSL